MPKPVTFTRESILIAAFDIFALEGLQAISARGIASRIGASTAPVYSCFSSIDEIRSELMQISLRRLLEYTEKEYTPDYFLNIGVGLLEFVKDYPRVYRAMFLEEEGNREIFEQFRLKNRVQMRKEPTISAFSEAQLENILAKLTVYTHGLAALICANMLDDTSTGNLIALLDDAGSAMIGYAAFRAGKMDLLDEYQRSQPGCSKQRRKS
jgi:AcrR family transcriptional regulator